MDLICQDGKGDPWTHVGYPVMEHGYSCSIIHENYLDAPEKSLDTSDWFSLADVYDDYSRSASFFSFLGTLARSLVSQVASNRSPTWSL